MLCYISTIYYRVSRLKDKLFSYFWIFSIFYLDHHRRRLGTLHDEYDKELETIRREFESEKELIHRCHTSELQYLHDVMFAMEQNHQEKENDARQDFQSIRDEIKNKVRSVDVSYSFTFKTSH